MVYKFKGNIFDDTECTVKDVSKEMPTIIHYEQITRVMLIQDFKSDQIFMQLKVKGAGSIMIPIDSEDIEEAKTICAFVQAHINGEDYTPPFRMVQPPVSLDEVSVSEEKNSIFKHKFSWCLLISFLLGMAYLIYSAIYWTNAASTNIGGTIAVSLVYPHLICLFLAVVLNFLSVLLRNTWVTMTAAILYTITIFLFPLYWMFVTIEAILCWVEFGLYVSKKR